MGIGDFSGGLFGIPSSCGLWWLYIVYHYYFHPVKYIHGAAGEKEGILENIVEERGGVLEWNGIYSQYINPVIIL